MSILKDAYKLAMDDNIKLSKKDTYLGYASIFASWLMFASAVGIVTYSATKPDQDRIDQARIFNQKIDALKIHVSNDGWKPTKTPNGITLSIEQAINFKEKEKDEQIENFVKKVIDEKATEITVYHDVTQDVAKTLDDSKQYPQKDATGGAIWAGWVALFLYSIVQQATKNSKKFNILELTATPGLIPAAIRERRKKAVSESPSETPSTPEA